MYSWLLKVSLRSKGNSTAPKSGACSPLSKEPVLIAVRRDQRLSVVPLSIPKHKLASKSCGSSQLFSLHPYPKLLQLMDFPPPAPHSLRTLLFQLYTLFSLPLLLYTPPWPGPAAGHVQFTILSLLGTFPKPLAVLSFTATIKIFPSPSPIPWSLHVLSSYSWYQNSVYTLKLLSKGQSRSTAIRTLLVGYELNNLENW